MSWFPIGPDFVFAPKNGNFKRLSRRNEFGRQGLTWSITVDPADPNTIYITESPSSGGTSAFRTRDDGTSWTPIADSLQQTNPHVDPNCFAVNPDHPATIYMGTYSDRGVYVSNSRGDAGTWSARNAINGSVRKIIVDPRTSASLTTTVLYAATTDGVYRSPDGGVTWTQVLAGDVWSLVAYMPATGTAHFYAGIWQQGVFHTTDPTVFWTNLNGAVPGLPAYTAPTPNFDAVFVDLCRRMPDRVYAWHMKRGATAGIYTTSSPTTLWTQVAAVSPPAPFQGLYAWCFAVAPNSPGNGTNDILVTGSYGMQRSIDGGWNWQYDATSFHDDQHSIAFSPENPPAGVLPATYIGTDGGIAKSSKFADPSVAISAPLADYNESYATADTFAWQNRNHGKQSSAVFQYASDPAVAALSYIGCQDTGVAAGDSALGWRGIADGDGGAIAAARASNGVAVWGILGFFLAGPPFQMMCWIDRGEFSPARIAATLPGGFLLAGSRGRSSNLVVGLDEKCLAGVLVHDSDTTLSAPVVASPIAQPAAPASMTNIVVGSELLIEPFFNEERVTVTAVTSTTFSAVFTRNHPAGAAIQNERSIVVRVDEAGTATPISQDFVGQWGIRFVAVHPANANVLYCATGKQTVRMTTTATTAGPATVWTEVATGRPAGLSIGSIAITSGGSVFVLLLSPVTSSGVTTPLFELSTGTWLPQTCTGLPTGFFDFGKLVADPIQPDTLYAAHGARVYQLVLSGGTWTWTDISGGLPGQWIYDLWIGAIGSGSNTKVLLRAAIPTRGVFERDVTAGAVVPAVSLYLRDNFLDQGWLNPSPEGIVNPYNPNTRVWHYQCADIKIDAQQQHVTAGMPDFFQTDPEGTPIPPLHHVLFDQLKERGMLPQDNAALVHVQVHNRSLTPANAVSVWVIFCRISAGVPALSTSALLGNAYLFWSQFQASGTIVPSLPVDSPWTAVGPPMVLNGIDVANPRIASWNWAIPATAPGIPGHYCMVAFVHSASSPVGETTRMNVDAITPTNPHVGQKNLYIAPAPRGRPMEEYIEFHNPTKGRRRADVVFDLRDLPPALAVSFHLTEPDTGTTPLRDVVEGVTSIRDEPVPPEWAAAAAPPTLLGRLLDLLRLFWCWLLNVPRWLLGLPRKPCVPPGRERLPHFVPVRFDAAPSALVRIRGVTLPPFGFGAALIRIEPNADLPPGSEYRFDVQQWVDDVIAGGATIAVVTAGEPERPEPLVSPSHDPKTDRATRERIKRESEGQRPVPPWAEEIIKQRRKEQHRD